MILPFLKGKWREALSNVSEMTQLVTYEIWSLGWESQQETLRPEEPPCLQLLSHIVSPSRSSPWSPSTISPWSPKKSASWKLPLPPRSASLLSLRKCLWNGWDCYVPSFSLVAAVRPWRFPWTRSIFHLVLLCIRHKLHGASSWWTQAMWAQGTMGVVSPTQDRSRHLHLWILSLASNEASQ